MALMILELDTFKSLVINKAEDRHYDQYCSNNFYYNEWRNFLWLEKKRLFEEYVKESSIEQLIEKDIFTWRIVFKKKPSVMNDNEMVITD